MQGIYYMMVLILGISLVGCSRQTEPKIINQNEILDEDTVENASDNERLGQSELILKQYDSQMGENWYLDIDGNQDVWIRLVCEAYEPEEGVNESPSKDIMLYTESEDAYIAIQNPQNNEKWTVIKLPEYGQWLEREVDMFLRMEAGL